MEMPIKMSYTPELYALVTSTLYALFGSVGAGIQIGALLSATLLSYLSHKLARSRLVLFGALSLGMSLALWGAVVAPVNAEWAHVIQTASEPLANAYSRLRARWEYGHAIAFLAWLSGYCFLQISVLSELAAKQSRKNAD